MEVCSQNGIIKLFLQITVNRRGDTGIFKHRQHLTKTKVCRLQLKLDYIGAPAQKINHHRDHPFINIYC